MEQGKEGEMQYGRERRCEQGVEKDCKTEKWYGKGEADEVRVVVQPVQTDRSSCVEETSMACSWGFVCRMGKTGGDNELYKLLPSRSILGVGSRLREVGASEGERSMKGVTGTDDARDA
jgi:hypothetical protein